MNKNSVLKMFIVFLKAMKTKYYAIFGDGSKLNDYKEIQKNAGGREWDRKVLKKD